VIAGFSDRIRRIGPWPAYNDLRTAWKYWTARASGFYDQVILAVHSDQALTLLQDATPQEREILGPFPIRRTTRSCIRTTVFYRTAGISGQLNYLNPRDTQDRAVLTYDMNILQSLKASGSFV